MLKPFSKERCFLQIPLLVVIESKDGAALNLRMVKSQRCPKTFVWSWGRHE